MNIVWKEAHPNNYTPGRTRGIDRVVIHVADGTYGGTLAWFADKRAGVSAHYTVSSTGAVGQSVSEHNTCWHSGDWQMNSRSIGIEHEGRQPGWKPTPAQLAASAELVAGICKRWNIPVDREHLIGHSEVNRNRAARKNCPGDGWPWTEFLALVSAYMAGPDPAHQAAPGDQRPIRIFHGGTNEVLTTATYVSGTDKVYISDAEFQRLKKMDTTVKPV